MTNTLVQAFDPDIFSLLAIEQLFAQFNTAKYCFMGYSKKPSERGSKVVIPIPSYIQGGDAPLTTIGEKKQPDLVWAFNQATGSGATGSNNNPISGSELPFKRGGSFEDWKKANEQAKKENRKIVLVNG